MVVGMVRDMGIQHDVRFAHVHFKNYLLGDGIEVFQRFG